MWENAVQICKELAKQYEEQVHDLQQLSALLRRMADFYDKIMSKLRPGPEYFRVAYYGRGFPPFLQNKVMCFQYQLLIRRNFVLLFSLLLTCNSLFFFKIKKKNTN